MKNINSNVKLYDYVTKGEKMAQALITSSQMFIDFNN